MLVRRTIETFRDTMRSQIDPSLSVGFVPTMGALHRGHLSLIKAARASNDKVVASVFVNPAQFGPTDDLDTYPRQLEDDARMLEEAGVDLIFAPDTNDMYAPSHCTYVDPVAFEETREGKSRPGFFRGVATVVTKLFNIVRPTRAYFGQKDAVQCCVIKQIVHDLNIPTEVVVMPTIREHDGLAMSSRNAYLSVDERAVAGIVFKSLMAAEEMWVEHLTDARPSLSSDSIKNAIQNMLLTESQITDIEYISVDSCAVMAPLEKVKVEEGCIVSLAVKLGDVRLIDNIVLGAPVTTPLPTQPMPPA